jgi:hypothetical protein
LLETLDCHRCGVVPESFPDFSELAVTQLADELQARPVDLPLIASRVRQVSGHWFFNLQKKLNLFKKKLFLETLAKLIKVLFEFFRRHDIELKFVESLVF